MIVDYNDNKTYGCIQRLVLNYEDKIIETFQWLEKLTLGTHTPHNVIKGTLLEISPWLVGLKGY